MVLTQTTDILPLGYKLDGPFKAGVGGNLPPKIAPIAADNYTFKSSLSWMGKKGLKKRPFGKFWEFRGQWNEKMSTPGRLDLDLP